MNAKPTMEELAARLKMQAHPEGGSFAERHYVHDGAGRAASGAIYYHLGPSDQSAFHQIDCDEYWCHIKGDDLEIWVVSPEGCLTVLPFGVGEGEEPLAHVPAGSIFAARHAADASEGTLVSCITVPRFTYEGFRLVEREELEALCPDALAFFG